MSVAVAEPESPLAAIADTDLTKATLTAVGNGLGMCEIAAKCVGLSAVPGHDSGLITGLIGVHGRVSGFITVNLSERFAIRAVEGLLQEKFGGLTSLVVDGVGELTNIVVGGIKSQLAGTPWGFTHITVPSVIVGKGYHIAYARGLSFLCATFENSDTEAVMLEDRLMQVSLSFLRL
ncbi:MAG: chemotaxis protein CheX [Planctomycetota bacterium]|nr:MAG: chemotaxis protein CheX [Planctomycetota bacterium]